MSSLDLIICLRYVRGRPNQIWYINSEKVLELPQMPSRCIEVLDSIELLTVLNYFKEICPHSTKQNFFVDPTVKRECLLTSRVWWFCGRWREVRLQELS